MPGRSDTQGFERVTVRKHAAGLATPCAEDLVEAMRPTPTGEEFARLQLAAGAAVARDPQDRHPTMGVVLAARMKDGLGG